MVASKRTRHRFKIVPDYIKAPGCKICRSKCEVSSIEKALKGKAVIESSIILITIFMILIGTALVS